MQSSDWTGFDSSFIDFDKSKYLHLCYCNRDEDWEDNDGALNTVSMTHPRLPVEHASHLVLDESECHPMQPGIWLAFLL